MTQILLGSCTSSNSNNAELVYTTGRWVRYSLQNLKFPFMKSLWLPIAGLTPSGGCFRCSSNTLQTMDKSFTLSPAHQDLLQKPNHDLQVPDFTVAVVVGNMVIYGDEIYTLLHCYLGRFWDENVCWLCQLKNYLESWRDVYQDVCYNQVICLYRCLFSSYLANPFHKDCD